MTLSEFYAWLEGYKEGWDEAAPNASQWGKVEEKLATVRSPQTSQGKFARPTETPIWRMSIPH